MPERPRLEPVGAVPGEPAAVVLLAHGGTAHSTEPAARRGLPYLRMWLLARAFARRDRGTAIYLLRYRVRGWNGAAADAFHDVARAVDELGHRHPGRPIVLVGHSMGGRAVLRAAGGPGVVAVCALAPWLERTDPVEQLAGRAVLVAHGDRDRMTDPAASRDFARRARAVTDRVSYVAVTGDGHAMLRRAGTWTALVRRFVLRLNRIEPPGPLATNTDQDPRPDGPRGTTGGERR